MYQITSPALGSRSETASRSPPLSTFAPAPSQGSRQPSLFTSTSKPSSSSLSVVKDKPRRRGMPISWGRGDELAIADNSVKILMEDGYAQGMKRSIVTAHKIFLEIRDQETQPSEEIDTLFYYDASTRLRWTYDQCIEHLEASAAKHDIKSNELEKLKLASAGWHLSEIMVLYPSRLVGSVIAEFAFRHFPRFSSKLGFIDEQLSAQKGDLESLWKVIVEFVLQGDLVQAWTYLKHHSRHTKALLRQERGQATKEDEEVLTLFDKVRQLLLEMPRILGPLDERTDINVAVEDFQTWQSAAFSPDQEGDFMCYWQGWRDAVEAFFMENEHTLHKLQEPGVSASLVDVFNILRGDIDKINHILTDEGSWMHRLGVVLLYRAPYKRKEDILTIALDVLGKSQENPEALINRIVLAALEENMTVVLQLLETEPFVTAHLAHILSCVGAIETTRSSLVMDGPEFDDPVVLDHEEFLLGDLQVDLREYYIIQYAVRLGLGRLGYPRNALAPSVWRLAADYLASLERQVAFPSIQIGSNMSDDQIVAPLGLPYMELIVEKQQPFNDQYCSKLIRACELMGLETGSIIRQRVMHWVCFRGGREKLKAAKDNGSGNVLEEECFVGIVNALKWAAKSAEDGMARSILDIVFSVSSLKTLDILVGNSAISFSSVGSSGVLNNEAMSFLSEYAKLHSFLQSSLTTIHHAKTLHQEQNRDTNAEISQVLDKAVQFRDQAVLQLSRIFSSGLVPRRFYLPLLRKVLLFRLEEDENDDDENDDDELKKMVKRKFMQTPPRLTVDQASMFQGYLEEPMDRKAFGGACPEGTMTLLRLVLAQSLTRSVIGH